MHGRLNATLALPGPLDLRLTLGPLRHGRSDPTCRIDPDGAWLATRTTGGPATVHVRIDGRTACVSAWGRGAPAALAGAPQLLGLHDDPSRFVPRHPVLEGFARRFRGLRMTRTGNVMEALVPAIIEQKVTAAEAHRSWSRLVRSHGEPAPGPGGLMLPPHPEVLASLPYWAYHPLGIERQRAAAIKAACTCRSRLQEAAAMPLAGAYRRLLALPGIGPWTAAETGRAAFGDADAVSVGDFHLPHLVSWMLAGEEWGSDERMLELLEPYRSQRARAVRLLELGGSRAPNHAIRAPLRSISGI